MFRDEVRIWCYDIETCISAKGKAYLESVDLGYDSRRKDPVKIEESRKEKKEKAMSKAALSWWLSEIVSIALVDFETSLSATAFTINEFGGSEKDLLSHVINIMWQEANAGHGKPLMVGKQNASFDDGFLVGRLMANRLGVPFWMKRDRPISDVNQIFGFSRDSANLGKLDEYLFGLDLPQKTGHGSEVQGMVERGEWQKLADYNAGDALAVAQILNLYNQPFMGVVK